MKPFSEAVQKAFPMLTGRLLDRPWWTQGLTPRVTRYVPELEKQYCAQTIEEAAQIDAKYPIPHPGYRAGQVWADEDGLSIIVLAVREGGWLTLPENSWGRESIEAHDPRIFSASYPYLVADPACPHLAPWSPVEDK